MTPQLGLFGKPAAVGGFTPRSYQLEADVAIDRELREHRSTLVVQATGLGKTVLFCMQAARRGGAIVLAHRDGLIRQAAEKLAIASGRRVAIEKAERTAFGSPYVAASVQTLKGDRLKRFAERYKDTPLIVVDEAHRAPSPSYRAIFEAFPNAKILGVTATADRTDGIAMGCVFDSVAHRYEILPATADAWLTEVEYVPLEASVDLDKISKKGRDLDAAQLDDAIAAVAGETARAILDHARDKRLIVFAPGVKASHAISGALNQLVPGYAAAADGETPTDVRDRHVERHRAGEIRALVNCDLWTEGHDDPTLDGIVDTAKTLSRIKAMQRLGRATRLYSDEIGKLPTVAERLAAIAASPKPKALWYDLVCNGERHQPIGPLDLLAGKLPDEVRKVAKKILEEKGGSVDAAVREAEARLEERERAMRAAKIAGSVRVRRGRVRSIFELAGIRRTAQPTGPTRPADRATPRQVGLLTKRGIPVPAGCTKREFKRLIGKDERQKAAGLCRLGGVHWLSWYGIDASRMPSAAAKRLQQAIIENGRMPLPAARIAELTARVAGDDGGLY